MVIAGALGAASACPAVGAPPPKLGKGVLLRTTVEPRARSLISSYRVPRSFLGFSIEINQALSYTGSYFVGVNQPFVAANRQLGQFGGGFPTLRLGGLSTDYAGWTPEKGPPIPGVHYHLGPFWADGVSRFLAKVPVRPIVGLNFATPSTDVALQTAQALRESFGPQTLFEYGNEPDLYGHSFSYVENGQHKKSTPLRLDWSFPRYLTEFSRKADFLRSSLPGVRLAGPGAVDPRWLPAFVQREHRFVRAVTVHIYALCGCVKKRTDPTYPSLANLLARRTILQPLSYLFRGVRAARHYRLPVRVSESGSVAAGGAGKLGASFASALWGLNWMFSVGEIGASGINFHTSGTYSPLVPGYRGTPGSGRWVMSFKPIFYSMLMFARATGNGARFLPDSTFLRSQGRPQVNVTTWATVDRVHTVNVVIVNSDLHAHGRVQVRIPHGAARGTVIRLSAPSPRSTQDVTLGGQQYASPSADAKLRGAFVRGNAPRRRDVYSVSMRPASAALLTVRTR